MNIYARDITLLLATLIFVTTSAAGQTQKIETPSHPPPPGERGSANMKVLSHIPLGEALTIADVDIEQNMDRPYAYVARRGGEIGFDVIDLEDPSNAKVIYKWRIENPELHQGGAMDGRYFAHEGRNYFVQSFQFRQGSPNANVGAIVFDVTGLPDQSKVFEVERISQSDTPGGFHNIFVYKHSTGKPLLFATSGQYSKVFDLDIVVNQSETEIEQRVENENRALVGRIPVPQSEDMWSRGYHDFYVGYHQETGQDRFYGGGGSGYYVFNITDLAEPEVLVTILGVPGVRWGHTFTPTPDGRYAIGETEWQYQPLRIFDLKPALDGEVDNIDHAIGVWHSDWKTLAHNHEVRWPYVFVSGYETGLSVFSMEDPTRPYTVAYYDTYDGPHNDREARRINSPYTWGIYNGAWGVDVRNADGLIVVSDMTTGFWALKMDGFNGWSGEAFGVPDVSSAQDWENGPSNK
ncbi:MAG: hypothetical protein HKN43_01470 [Rhodothermales bacterium]|nr:hypothetical protein [Rhodothermales bacterium]